MIPEDEMIQKSKDNDLEAFQQLVETYYPVVERFAYQLGNDFHDVADITQEVFVRVYRFLDQYSNAKFTTWLYKITLNVTRDFGRKHSRFNKKIIKLKQEYHEENTSFESEVLQKEEDRYLHACIQQLNEKYRVPLVLYYFHDKKYEEIAEILDLRLATVKTRLLRAKNLLKEIYEKQKREENSLNG